MTNGLNFENEFKEVKESQPNSIWACEGLIILHITSSSIIELRRFKFISKDNSKG